MACSSMEQVHFPEPSKKRGPTATTSDTASKSEVAIITIISVRRSRNTVCVMRSCVHALSICAFMLLFDETMY